MIVKLKDQINNIWEYRDQTTPLTPSMDEDDDTYEKKQLRHVSFTKSNNITTAHTHRNSLISSICFSIRRSQAKKINNELVFLVLFSLNAHILLSFRAFFSLTNSILSSGSDFSLFVSCGLEGLLLKVRPLLLIGSSFCRVIFKVLIFLNIVEDSRLLGFLLLLNLWVWLSSGCSFFSLDFQLKSPNLFVLWILGFFFLLL